MDKYILLVEDNPDDAELTLRALKKGNIKNEIVWVKAGAEALDFLLCTGQYVSRKIEDMPAVMVLDLNMPKIGGLEVLRRVRSDERLKLLPIVILSTSKQESDIITSYNLGANSYIKKPVDFDNFAQAVVTLGLYWLLLNEPPVKCYL